MSMLAPSPPPRQPGIAGIRAPVRRDDDRRVAIVSLVVAGVFLLSAAGAVAVPLARGEAIAPWLPIHLALAGGATAAIAGVMPFFVAALGAAPPVGMRLRAAALGLVAVGAAAVAGRGIVPGVTWLPTTGAVVYLAGIVLTALAVAQAGRRGLMARRPAVLAGYLLALLNVAVGATIGFLFLVGLTPVLDRWAALRGAHAWANLVGFVSLVVAATLLHLLPTVLGTRIVPRAAGLVTVLGLGLGAPLVVAGFALGSDGLVRLGAVATLAGVAGLVLEAIADVRARGRWTTDAGWHLVTGGMLLAAAAWFAVGAGMAASRLVTAGAGPGAWSTAAVGGPLVVGWIIQVLIGSWSHLIPAIGRGGPGNHALRRATLGRLSRSRLAALNLGVALLSVGWPAGIGPLAAVGVVLVVAVLVVSLWLAARALRVRDAAAVRGT